MRNVPQGLMYLSTWSPDTSVVRKGCGTCRTCNLAGGQASLGWGWTLKFYNLLVFYLCFLNTDQMRSLCFLTARPATGSSCHAFSTIMVCFPSGTISKNNPFSSKLQLPHIAKENKPIHVGQISLGSGWNVLLTFDRFYCCSQ